jgi:hypothetical protein
LSAAALQVDFDNLPRATSQHFFVDIDSSNARLVKEAAGLDSTITNPESITQFLTLPTITTRANPRRRSTDPLVDFTKSVMLTVDVYLDVVQQLHERKNQTTIDKERRKTEKAKSKRRKL